MESNELTKKARKIIKANEYMTLSIQDKDGVWCSPLWYADSGTTIYFVSNHNSRHSKAIKNFPQVALSIFNSSLPPEEINGIQVSGICTEVNTIIDALKAISCIFKKKGSEFFNLRFKNPRKPFEYLKGKFRIYKIEITHAFILDTDIVEDDIRKEIDLRLLSQL